MLNPFPSLLTYSFWAPFILRVVVGFIFVDLGILAFKKEKERWVISLATLGIPKQRLIVKIIGTLEIACGLMLIAGFYTQIAALILAIFTFAESYVEFKNPDILKRNLVFYVMLFVMVFSLVLTGAGALAFDLPL